MSTEQDKLLFSRIKGGSRESFNELFTKHYNRLCNFARGILKIDDIAEECVQEVFIHLWDNRDNIDVTKSLIAFLYTCVRNHAFNKIEKNKVRRKYEESYASLIQQQSVENSGSEEFSSRIHLVKKAVETLPAKCREIFEMSRYEGLTYHEISEYLNVSVKTVENQMGIAFQKLRAYVIPRFTNTNI